MAVKVTGNCFQLLSHASSSPQSLASVFSSKRRDGCEKTITCCHLIHQRDQHHSPFLGSTSTKLSITRSLSLDNLHGCGRRSQGKVLRRVFSASFDQDSSDVDFFLEYRNEEAESSTAVSSSSPFSTPRSSISPPWQPVWPDIDETVPSSIERKANSVDLPLSLRIIKRKKRGEGGLKEAGESACSSVKKAFSSMVFIVRELQSYTLQMREILFYENLQGILARVQGEMNASFVWLFEQIFYCTPTLMMYVMLLLANFTVYSIGHNAAFAAVPPQSVIAVEQNYYQENDRNSRFDASSIRTFSVGKTASVGGNSGGGGKVRPVAGATDDSRSDGSSFYYGNTIIPNTISTVPGTIKEEGVGEESVVVSEEEVTATWSRIVEEANTMKASLRHEALMDPNVLQQLVSPVSIEFEPEDQSEYWKTEFEYQSAVTKDPDNALLLCNFAQFLYLVVHDLDRAEHYFKRAVGINPTDADSLSKYASFLWLGRNNLGAAEETYLEAIAADPSNTYHAANYAHFLWNTGGEDTCFPIDCSEEA